MCSFNGFCEAYVFVIILHVGFTGAIKTIYCDQEHGQLENLCSATNVLYSKASTYLRSVANTPLVNGAITDENLMDSDIFFSGDMVDPLSTNEIEALQRFMDRGKVVIITVSQRTDLTMRNSFNDFLAPYDITISSRTASAYLDTNQDLPPSLSCLMDSDIVVNMPNAYDIVCEGESVSLNEPDNFKGYLFTGSNGNVIVIGSFEFLQDGSIRNYDSFDNARFFHGIMAYTAQCGDPNPVSAAPSVLTPLHTSVPTPVPTNVPTPVPTSVPTPVPTSVPTPAPTSVPTHVPTSVPPPTTTSMPTPAPTSVLTPAPTSVPTPVPTSVPTHVPTSVPPPTTTGMSTPVPTSVSTPVLTSVPTQATTSGPIPATTSVLVPVSTSILTPAPTSIQPTPSQKPTGEPGREYPISISIPIPTDVPVPFPSIQPSQRPSSQNPSGVQTFHPTNIPTVLSTSETPTEQSTNDPEEDDGEDDEQEDEQEDEQDDEQEDERKDKEESEEEDEDPLSVCGPGEWRCDNGQCINTQYECNGILDCMDGTDEIHCSTEAPAVSANFNVTSGLVSSCSLNGRILTLGISEIQQNSTFESEVDCDDFQDNLDSDAINPEEYFNEDSKSGFCNRGDIDSTVLVSRYEYGDISHCIEPREESDLISAVLDIDMLEYGEYADSFIFNISYHIDPDLCENEIDESESISCEWIETNDGVFDPSGCELLGTQRNETSMIATCHCFHLTAFAILLDSVKYKDDCHASNVFGNSLWVAYIVLYSLLLAATLQQIQYLIGTNKSSYGVLSKQFMIRFQIGVICVLNISIAATFLRANPEKPLKIVIEFLAVFWAALYISSFWVYSVVVYTWATVYHLGIADSTKQYMKYFFAGCCSCVTVLVIFMFTTVAISERDKMKAHVTIGSTAIGIICLILAISYSIYGVLVIRMLKETDGAFANSPNSIMKDAIGRVVNVVSCCFVMFLGQTIIILISARNADLFFSHFSVFQSLYLSFDLILLSMVLYLFYGVIRKELKISLLNTASAQSSGNKATIQMEKRLVDKNTLQ